MQLLINYYFRLIQSSTCKHVNKNDTLATIAVSIIDCVVIPTPIVGNIMVIATSAILKFFDRFIVISFDYYILRAKDFP